MNAPSPRLPNDNRSPIRATTKTKRESATSETQSIAAQLIADMASSPLKRTPPINEEAGCPVSSKAVFLRARPTGQGGPVFLPGLTPIGCASLVRTSNRLQLAQTRDETLNLVWHLPYQHIFRGDPQDGPEPLEELRIKKSMHGCSLRMEPALRRPCLPVSHGQCVRGRVVPAWATENGEASVRGLGCLGYSSGNDYPASARKE